MSHSEDVYEHHEIVHHDPSEGFDRTEPNARAIWGFTIGSISLLVLIIVALQGYFEQLWQSAVYEKVLSAPSEQLQGLRNRDAYNLSHYMYGDLNKASGRVRIPLEKAMELMAQDAAAGKTFYPAKATVPKKDDNPEEVAKAEEEAKKAEAAKVAVPQAAKGEAGKK